MLKRIKIFLLIVFLCLSIMPNMVFAEENIVEPDFTKVKNEFNIKEIEEFVPYNEIKINNDNVSLKSDACIKSYNTELNKELFVYNNAGDFYEPNDGSDTAHPISFNHIIEANLNTESDQDWYKFDITKYDVENCTGGVFAVILKNIPFGKDYDMYLFKRQPNGGMGYTPCEKRTNSVASYFDISEGSYMVAVFAKDNIPNNFSDKNYELYVGNALIPKSTGYMDTNLEFNFGFHNYPKRFLSEAQYLDLSNDDTIPTNSLIKTVIVTSSGNGAYWAGLTKIFDGYQAAQALDYINLPEYELPVKENHFIQAYINRSNGFIWKPRVMIDYVYPLIENNYRFYFGM